MHTFVISLCCLYFRVNAEENAATLARQRELDEQKMQELEKIRTQLESLLEEERQAKKDEEIVRTLQVNFALILKNAKVVHIKSFQARILNEEWARRETLERLQEEQKAMLESERKKREEFEREQNDKEKQLRGIWKTYKLQKDTYHDYRLTFSEAQQRVEEMENERRKLDRQLNIAQEKTKRANLGQEVLEAKIKVINMIPLSNE